MWIKGINSVVSKFGFDGVRPSPLELKAVTPSAQTPLALKVLRFYSIFAPEHVIGGHDRYRNMINTLEQQYVLPRRTPEQQYAHTKGISGAEALQSSPAALLVLSELNVLLKQQYGYNLEDLEKLELEARTSPVTQWQSSLKEMGYTHEQISSARQALGRTWGIARTWESQVDDYDAILEWLVNNTAEP